MHFRSETLVSDLLKGLCELLLTSPSGHGVVLTATWLLPVALIPMAWDAGDIYGPPLAPKDTPVEDSKGDKDKGKKGK